MDIKKRRIGNFTRSEKLDLVAKLEVKSNRVIIENKKTDGVTSKQKEECWRKIANELNSECVGEHRNVNALKNCWDNLKKKTRKHYAAIRQERFATGGGTMDIPEDPLLDRVRAIIQPSVDGMVNPFDSDAASSAVIPEGNNGPETFPKFEDENYNENDDFMVIESLDETPELNWTDWNPKMLRQKKSKELEVDRSSERLTFADVDAALAHQLSTSQPRPSTSQHGPSISEPRPSTSQPRHSQSITSNTKRKRTLGATNSTRVNATTRNKHFAALAQSKFELVEMMKEDMRAKSEIEIEILKTQLEKEQLEVELLKHELQKRRRQSETED